MKTHLVLRRVFLLTVLAATAPAIASPGDRVQRHPDIACTNCRSEDLWPAVDSDATGHSLVVWYKNETDFAHLGLWGRWFGPDGHPRSAQFRVSPVQTSFDGTPDSPSVALRPDGAGVVTWLARGLFKPDSLRARLFDSHGVPTGAVITVDDGTREPLSDQMNPPRVAIDDDGDFAVAWPSVNRNTGNWIVWVRLYDKTGAPRGPAFSADPNGPSPRARIPDLAMDAAGNLVVVWLQEQANVFARSVFGRRFDAAGVARGARFAVSSSLAAGVPGVPAVAAARDGRFVVGFDRGRNDPATGFVSLGVFARQFDATGAPVGGERRASAPGQSTYRGEVDVAMDDDGDFVVAWIGQEPAFGQTNLHTRLYAASGAALTPDRYYGFDHVGPRFERVAMDDVGNFVATWEHSSPDPDDQGFGFGPNVFVQHFAGPDDTRPGCAAFIAGIVGTAGNDALRGTAGDDVIHALGGNDLVTSGAGADIACGGAGGDQLFGESGTDHLLGGTGDDALDGGDGLDICNGNGQVNADTAIQCERVLQVP
jgi:hypothetical protein